jgi:hypothetical protein
VALLEILCRPGKAVALLEILCRPRKTLALLEILCRPGGAVGSLEILGHAPSISRAGARMMSITIGRRRPMDIAILYCGE